MAGVILILTIMVCVSVLALLSELIGAVGNILESIGTFIGLIVLEIMGKGTKESKEKLKNFIILIRFILLSILLSLIYLLIWHFIIVILINDEGVTILSKIVFAVIGFNLMTYYEHCIDNARIARFLNGENLRISYHFEINPLLRIILIPIAIPVFISTYICDWITDHIYGNKLQTHIQIQQDQFQQVQLIIIHILHIKIIIQILIMTIILKMNIIVKCVLKRLQKMNTTILMVCVKNALKQKILTICNLGGVLIWMIYHI